MSLKRFLHSSAKAHSSLKTLAHDQSFMVTTYARPEMILNRGQGSYLFDDAGNKYVDLTAGIAVTCLGHSHPKVTEIITDQASTLLHSSNLYYNDWVGELSRSMVETTRAAGGMKDAAKLFLANSGSEANEAALKFARKVGKASGKTEFVAFKGGFHGRTFGSLSATCNPKYQAPFSPMVPGFSFGELNSEASLDLITDKTCGVIVEPIQGEGGVNVASTEWLEKIRAKCDSVGAVLIYDEIQCGLGRTGKLWAHQYLDKAAHPDIVTMAKALGNGYPVGATMISDKINDVLQVGDHGTTYGGNPMAARIGTYVLSQVSSAPILENVAARSQQVVERVDSWKQKFGGLVTELRGRGLLLGVQLSTDPAPAIQSARDNGLLVITCGTNTLRLVPALNISEAELNEGLDILEHGLGKI